jgi:uncharacterized protein
MAELRNHSEPSMEEILASIRRIIVDDNGPLSNTPAGQKAAPATPSTMAPTGAMPPGGPNIAGQAPPLRVAGADPGIRSFPPVPPNVVPPKAPRSPPVQEAILDLTERVDDEDLVHRAALTTPFMPTPPPSSGRLNRPPPFKGGAEPRLASDAALAASVATLSKIAGIGQAVRQAELPLGDVGRTLEDMVRELLRPHMKEWLDANLPRLVERLVRDEIARLVREAQER